MSAVYGIALNTFREAVRDKVLYLLVFFGCLIVLGSEALAVLAVGDPEKVVLDLGLASIYFFGVVIAAFLGLSQVAREIDRRTVFTVVSKPISRGQFLTGKLLGAYATVVMLSLVMTVVFLGFVELRFGVAHPRLLLAITLFLVEEAVILAFALLFSSFTTPILATLFSLTLFVVGHLVEGLKMLAEYPQVGGAGRKVLMGLYYLLPNLERFDIKAEVVHGLQPPIVEPVLYGLIYALAIFFAAQQIFRRKDFI